MNESQKEKERVIEHVMNTFIVWKNESETARCKITINEHDVPFAYTFGNNVCGDYIRTNVTGGEDNYIITNLDNLRNHLNKIYPMTTGTIYDH